MQKKKIRCASVGNDTLNVNLIERNVDTNARSSSITV